MSLRRQPCQTIVVTGVGLVSSLGADRESVWGAVRKGASGVRSLAGLEGIPDHLLIGAPADIAVEQPGQLKVIALAQRAAAEAIHDAQFDIPSLDLDRFGCAISGHMGDTGWVREHLGLPHPDGPDAVAWWRQWMPNTACTAVANHFGLAGPRLCHSTACASGLIDVLAAMRAIQDGQCEMALAGSADAFHPLFAAGFHAMKVLAHHADPRQACRPFDRGRNGFVMGEGAAMFVLERLDHALARGARIYAELCGGKLMGAAHHVTSVGECDALAQLIRTSLQRAGCRPKDIEYINAHGTGTQQNDSLEIRGIRQALGRMADRVLVSSSKSMLGHLVNAAGSVELAITILALRDGFLPPTLNLTDPDPECDLDCIPLAGRRVPAETALKLSVAFGGHLAAVIVRRWSGKGASRSPAYAPAFKRRPASIYGEEYGGSAAQTGGLRPARTATAVAHRHVG
ncbi:MAG TPA: beta-ketoacyl-[acyl-carrier-protein] synthase family protein [Pirellulales bacterium]|nr:beta-ketoacyl-[acyl-carrier-protein] synthase family protein [Pirellulales bacterium]